MELEGYHQLGLLMINRISQSRPPTDTVVAGYLGAAATSRVKDTHPSDELSLSSRTWNEHRGEALSYWKSSDFSKLPKGKVDKRRADACAKESFSAFCSFLRVLLERSPTAMEASGARAINLDEVGAASILLGSSCDLSLLSFSSAG